MMYDDVCIYILYVRNIDMHVPKISENHMGQRFSLQLQRRASDGPQLGWSPLHRCVARLGHGCPADTSGDLMVSGAKRNMRNIGRRNPNPWPNSGRGGFRVQSESGTSSPQVARLWNLGTWWCCTIVPSFHRISRTGSKHNCRILQQNVGISNAQNSPNTKVLDILVKNVLGNSLDSQPLNALLVDHSAGAHGHMVTLGEDPGIEVRRHILPRFRGAGGIHHQFPSISSFLQCTVADGSWC